MSNAVIIWGGSFMGIDILLFLILGLFVGTFGTLVGIGGGFARHFAPEFFQHRDSVKQAV